MNEEWGLVVLNARLDFMQHREKNKNEYFILWQVDDVKAE